MTRINHGNQTEIRAIIADIKAMCHLMGCTEMDYMKYKHSYLHTLKTYGANERVTEMLKERRAIVARHTVESLQAKLKLGLI